MIEYIQRNGRTNANIELITLSLLPGHSLWDNVEAQNFPFAA